MRSVVQPIGWGFIVRGECGRYSGGSRLERFQAKACPGLDPGWGPVRVKKTRQIKNLEPRFDSIETRLAPGENSDVRSNGFAAGLRVGGARFCAFVLDGHGAWPSALGPGNQPQGHHAGSAELAHPR